MEGEFPLCGGRIDAFGQGDEVHAFLFEGLHLRDQVFQRAAKPVQSPDYERVALSELLQAPLKLGTRVGRAADLFLIDFFATGFLELVELEVEVLVAGGHPGVTDAHGRRNGCFKTRFAR